MRRSLASLFALALAAPALASAPLASFSTSSTTDNLGNVNTVFGETFRTPNDGSFYTLDSATFDVKKVGSPSGTLTAKLYKADGVFGDSSVAAGSALAVSASRPGTDFTTSTATYTWTFSDAFRMSPNEEYAIVLEASTNDASNYWQVSDVHSDSSGVPSGNITYKQAAGFLSLDWDVSYAVYGTSVAAASTSASDSQALSDASQALVVFDYEFGVLACLAVFSGAAFWGWRLVKGNPKD